MITLIIILLVLIALYLFLIMPGLKRPDSSALSPHLYAHRGLHDGNQAVAENGMKAFSLAVEAGYGIELDVQLTSDQRLVVFHDETLARVCGVNKKLHEMTFDELRAVPLPDGGVIPTFDEVLSLVGGRVPLIVEVKYHGDVTAIASATLKRLLAYKGAYCVESFHPMAVKYFQKHAPNIVRGQLASGAPLGKDGLPWYQHFAMKYLLVNALSRPHFVAYDVAHDKNLSMLLMKKLYRPLLAAWTVRDKETLRYAKEAYTMPIFERFSPND